MQDKINSYTCILTYLHIGIVFYLSPGSKVTEVIEKNRFPELVQALLGEKYTKDIEQLKVKAVLEYDNGDYFFLSVHNNDFVKMKNCFSSK